MEPRNYDAGAAGTPPVAPSTPSTGYPTEGNPQSAIPATKPGPHWFYKVGESLRNVITSAGLTPDDADLNLVQKAIVKLIGQSNHVVRLDSATFAPAVADGNAVYWDETNTRYDKAIADGTDKQDVVGFADVTNSLVEAFGLSNLFSGLTAGSRYYLSAATAGAITTVVPSESVLVGLAKSAATLFVDIDVDSKVDPVVVSSIITVPTSSVPTGYLECNGAEISRSSYANLFLKLGTLYGVGDGSSTFNLPDLRGEFIRGWDDGRGVDVGRGIGSWQADEFKSHLHGQVWTNAAGYTGFSQSTSWLGNWVGNTGLTGGAETRPRNIAMMFCIKY